MEVTVKDNRKFPDYKNVPVVSYIRNSLNQYGLDWVECEKIGKWFQEVILDADYLSDDHGNTWARSFTPKGNM